MSAKFVQNGDTIDYTPVSAVAAGAFVDLGFAVGVAKLPIPAGALGALALVGVYDFDVSALSEAKAVGTALYVDGNGALTWSANDGAQTPTAYTRVGHLVAAAASGATVVRVRLG